MFAIFWVSEGKEKKEVFRVDTNNIGLTPKKG